MILSAYEIVQMIIGINLLIVFSS